MCQHFKSWSCKMWLHTSLNASSLPPYVVKSHIGQANGCSAVLSRNSLTTLEISAAIFPLQYQQIYRYAGRLSQLGALPPASGPGRIHQHSAFPASAARCCVGPLGGASIIRMRPNVCTGYTTAGQSLARSRRIRLRSTSINAFCSPFRR